MLPLLPQWGSLVATESVYQVGSKEHLMARAADPQGELQTYAGPPREISGATLCYKSSLAVLSGDALAFGVPQVR